MHVSVNKSNATTITKKKKKDLKSKWVKISFSKVFNFPGSGNMVVILLYHDCAQVIPKFIVYVSCNLKRMNKNMKETRLFASGDKS